MCQDDRNRFEGTGTEAYEGRRSTLTLGLFYVRFSLFDMAVVIKPKLFTKVHILCLFALIFKTYFINKIVFFLF